MNNAEPRRWICLTAGLLLAVALPPAPAAAEDPADYTIEEFVVPTPNSKPWAIDVDAEGRAWFSEFSGRKIACFDPSKKAQDKDSKNGRDKKPKRDRRFEEYPVTRPPRDIVCSPRDGSVYVMLDQYGDGAYGVLRPGAAQVQEISTGLSGASAVKCALDPAGTLWFNGWNAGKLCQVTSNGIERFNYPEYGNCDGLTEDEEGFFWIPLGEGGPRLLSFDPTRAKPGTSQGFGVINLPLNYAVIRFTMAAVGRIWFALQDRSQIASYDPRTGEMDYYDTPTPNAAPGMMAADRWGRIWFAEHLAGAIGVLDLRTGTIREFRIPSAGGGPLDVAVDKTRDVVWYTDYLGNKIGRLVYRPTTIYGDPPAQETLTDEFDVPHDYKAAGVAGTMWAGMLFNSGTDYIQNGVLYEANASLFVQGQFTVRSALGDWEHANDDGFMLYVKAEGDFVAELEIASADFLYHNDMGIIARVPTTGSDDNAAGDGEDYVANRYYTAGGFNAQRIVNNGVTQNINSYGLYRFLQLERAGDTFYLRRKQYASNSWSLMGTVNRADLHGLPLQVGIWQGTFTYNAGTARFERFSITANKLLE
ncbi:MAG: hypothetical protein V1873_02880 [Verrucomicrobiota bacterium]